MNRRVDIRAILTNPKQRRELFISLLIATQAREGIETTQERAEEVYDKIYKEKVISDCACPKCTWKPSDSNKEKETKKGPVPKKPSYETLKKALIDILDGSSQWYDIQYHTGLSNKRSEEISKLFNQLVGK